MGSWSFSTSFEGLAEGPGKAMVSEPEQLPPHFDGLRALGLARERNLLDPFKSQDSLGRAVTNICCGDGRASHWQGLREETVS